ncbi:MAG: hypothetical protein ACTHJ8_19835 [Mucilaginibacter sp.]
MLKLSAFILITIFLQPNNHLQKHLLNCDVSHGEKSIYRDTTVKLCTFTAIPDDIAGCVCYFYLTKADEKKRVYIMVENFAEEGYVSINDKIQKFHLVSFKDMNYYFYSNGAFNLKVEIKNKVPREGEDFRVTGVITLLKGKVILAKRNFIGECAC